MNSNLSQNAANLTGQTVGLFNGKKIFRKALKFWYLYLISLLVCLGYAWFTIRYATPMYKVSGQLIIQNNNSNNNISSQAISGNGMNIGTLFNSNVNIQNEIALLQTHDLCRKVVDQQKLYINYLYGGNIRTVELYDGCPFQLLYDTENDSLQSLNIQLTFATPQANQFNLKIGDKTMLWHFYDTLHYKKNILFFVKKGDNFKPEAIYTVSIKNPDAIADNIVGNLLVMQPVSKSTILTITYNTNIPRKGERVLKGIMDAYINSGLESKNVTSDSTIQFINERIGIVGTDLNNIENTIQSFRERNKITDITTESGILLSNRNTYFQQLNNLDVQLQVIATMLSYVSDESNNRRPVPSLLSSDATFSGLVSSYNEVQIQRDKILLTLKNDNPIVVNLDNQIAAIRGDMITSLRSQEKALNISKQNLSVQNMQINNQIGKVPVKERQFLDYSREQDLKQTLFLFLLQRREEIAIAKASNSADAAIVTTPKANGFPYAPTPTSTYTIAILIGLFLPTAVAILSILMNNKVSSRDDVTDATPVTILSEIGHNRKAGLLNLAEEGRAMIAEQFRIFRTNMEFALSGAHSPVIMVTSTMSGEGKSFIAANLGQIYAISGKKTLLIEMDLRKPKLTQTLNVSYTTGFSNFIVSDLPIQSFIQPIEAVSNNLFILPAGTIPPNPAELLLSKKTAAMIEELKKIYDIVIIDTAPIGAVTDAQIISTLATATLYILRQGYTTKNSFGIINDLVLNNKIQPLYLIINDISGNGSSYNYGYGYSYGYGYGYYESSEEKETKKFWKRKA